MLLKNYNILNNGFQVAVFVDYQCLIDCVNDGFLQDLTAFGLNLPDDAEKRKTEKDISSNTS